MFYFFVLVFFGVTHHAIGCCVVVGTGREDSCGVVVRVDDGGLGVISHQVIQHRQEPMGLEQPVLALPLLGAVAVDELQLPQMVFVPI